MLAAGAAAAAVAAVVHAASGPASATESVLVAARDLPAGRVLAADDLARAAWPVGARPRGGLVQAVAGRTLASPLRKGEPVTDARLVGRGLLAGQPTGVVAVSVRLADPAGASMLRAGDRVDVLAAPGSDLTAAASADGAGARDGVSAQRVVQGALVLAVGPSGESSTGTGAGGLGGLGLAGVSSSGSTASGQDAGGLLVLAVDRPTAARLAALDGSRQVSVALASGF